MKEDDKPETVKHDPDEYCSSGKLLHIMSSLVSDIQKTNIDDVFADVNGTAIK